MEIQDVERTEQTNTHQYMSNHSKDTGAKKMRQFLVKIKRISHTTGKVLVYHKVISACNMQQAKQIVENELIIIYPRCEVSYKVNSISKRK